MSEIQHIIDHFEEFEDTKYIVQNICHQTLKDCKFILKNSPYECRAREAFVRKRVYKLIKLLY